MQRAIHPDGLPVPHRYWSMLAIGLGITMAVLDSAIANVALPTIARELHATPAESIWVINAYQLAIVISLLPLASLGEIVGYRRIYQVGLAVFTAASLGCALSHSLVLLVGFRTLQGFGAAGIMSVNGALVRFTYPQRQLGAGVGLNALIVSVAAAVGPTVASGILAVGAWEWLFAVNVPIGLINLAVAARALPYSEQTRRPFDHVAAGLNALMFALFFIGVDLLTRDVSSPAAWLTVAAAVGAGVLLVRREADNLQPLIPIDLLRIPVFSLSVLTSVASFGAQILAFIALPFYFETVLHRDQVQTGLLMTPWPLAVGVSAPIAGRLADRLPAAVLGGAGLALLAVGLLCLATLPADVDTLGIAWRMALCGLGFGMFQSPNNRTLLTAAPRRRAGAAGGMLATARLTGQTGGAVATALIFRIAVHGAEALCLLAGAGLAVLAAVISLLRLSGRASPSGAAPELGEPGAGSSTVSSAEPG